MKIYVVQPGDTVDKIAQEQRADLDALIEINQLVSPYRLAVGQALLLSPVPFTAGGRGSKIASRVDSRGRSIAGGVDSGGRSIAGRVDLGERSIAGGVDSGERSIAGRVDSGESSIAPGVDAGGRRQTEDTMQLAVRQKIFSSGYAYPFISPQVLEETLPYLSELAVFSYGFTTEGDLIPPTLDDKWMVEEARKFGAMPTLTLTPLGEDGHFNNSLVSVLVRQQALQRKLVTGLAAVMLEKGYEALNIDFEYVLREDRDLYTGFVVYITNVMNMLGYQVSVALAPKYSDSQPGVLYEGIDYGGLGAAANWVVLMAYEWGYTYDQIGLW